MRSLIIAYTLLAVALAGCSSDDPAEQGEKMTVVFELTGTGTVTNLRYNDTATERMVQIDEPTQLPWRKELTGRKRDYVTLSAIAEGTATCKLTVDGKEVATATDTGVVECRVG